VAERKRRAEKKRKNSVDGEKSEKEKKLKLETMGGRMTNVKTRQGKKGGGPIG